VKRREFISTSVAAPLAAVGACILTSGRAHAAELPRRKYGKEGFELSVIGFGGIIVSGETQEDANRMVAEAVERGVNYFDVAPTYGNAQERLGPALEPFRKDCFLACKTEKRDAASAQAALEESLKLLRTDHVDLYQLHGLTLVEEVETCFAAGGVMEVFTAARDKGQALHLGFSAHNVEAALRAMDLFDFDSVLFPFNCVCMINGKFGQEVLDKAKDKGVSCLALKALAWTPWPEGAERTYPKCWYEPIADKEKARLALRYTLSLPVVAAVPPGHWELFDLALDIATAYEPLEEGEMDELMTLIAGVTPVFKHEAV